jgi:hypothetical protein
MFYEEGHPDVTLKDWQGFKAWQKSCKILPLHHIDEVIDRSETKLPDRVLPLARGGAIASTALLRKAGYRSGSRQPRRWDRIRPGWWELSLDTGNLRGLDVKKIGSLWMVGRWHHTPYVEYLVFLFGSTPIFTRECRLAKQLAWYCSQNDLPSGLCWVRRIENYELAIEFARQRTIDEAGCLTGGRHGLLH